MDLKFDFEKNANALDIARTYKMLKVMADTGASREVIASLFDFSLGNQLSVEQKRFLQAPIIQHKSAWTDTTPAWMYTAITADRLKIIAQEIINGETNGWRVGAAEIAVVTLPATYEAPLRYELAQLYLWAGATAKANFENKPTTDIFNAMAITPIENKDVLEKGGQYYQTYQGLSSEIRRKVVKEQILRERSYNRMKPSSDLDKKTPPLPKSIQLDLF